MRHSNVSLLSCYRELAEQICRRDQICRLLIMTPHFHCALNTCKRSGFRLKIFRCVWLIKDLGLGVVISNNWRFQLAHTAKTSELRNCSKRFYVRFKSIRGNFCDVVPQILIAYFLSDSGKHCRISSLHVHKHRNDWDLRNWVFCHIKYIK